MDQEPRAVLHGEGVGDTSKSPTHVRSWTLSVSPSYPSLLETPFTAGH